MLWKVEIHWQCYSKSFSFQISLWFYDNWNNHTSFGHEEWTFCWHAVKFRWMSSLQTLFWRFRYMRCTVNLRCNLTQILYIRGVKSLSKSGRNYAFIAFLSTMEVLTSQITWCSNLYTLHFSWCNFTQWDMICPAETLLCWWYILTMKMTCQFMTVQKYSLNDCFTMHRRKRWEIFWVKSCIKVVIILKN